ncbi:MAG: putative drug exporter of the superfamily [Gaiellaceae bacterium]|jgi:RND superfamily putative drug exporter|nr:putative drug exporter of the superfamily [Gaiellaceae bacterium]
MLKLTRWTISHRRIVVIAWIVLAVGALAASQAIGQRNANNFSLPNTDSQRAVDLLQSRFPAQAGDADQIVFRTRTGKLTDASARATIAPVLARIAKLPHVAGVVSPYDAGTNAISKAGTIGFATVEFDQTANQLPKAAIDRVITTAESMRSPALQVELGGEAIKQAQQASLGFATGIGLLAAIVVLLISFGSVLAMGLPILTALLGLGAGLGMIGLGSHLVDMADFSSELALMIGLGVGIDYALFIVTRYRDAYRENGGDVKAAVELAMNTAGRAILFAGATVVIALLGMFALGVSFLYGAAIAASLGVLFVLAASLTLLPALLMFSGKRVGRVRSRRSRPREARAGFWLRWVGVIQRRPVWAALASTSFLLVLAAPALGLRLGSSDSGNDPTKQTTRRAYDLLAQGFGSGFNGPLLLAVHLPATGDTAGLTQFSTTLRQTSGVASVAAPRLNPARDTAAISVYPTTSPQSAATTSLVKRLRNDVLPPIAKATGTAVYVGGATATQVDFAHVLAGKLPLFIGLVVLVSALLLLIVFRSLLIPVQAALMNLLSIAASLGVVQAIFERGWLAGVIGVQPGPIEAFIPVMVFAIVFGLSMDYEVFLVSRIHEEWQHRGDASAAVREGVASTGRVITAAAAVMVAVFISFAAGDDRALKLFGVAMATAVFLDAIVIRSILMPAVLELFGRRTWAFPNWADRRLPRLAIEPAVKPQPEPALENAA